MAANTKVVLENLVDGYLADSKSIRGSYIVVSTLSDFENLSPTAIVNGSLAYCQYDSKFYQYNGSQWHVADLGGGGVANLMTEVTYSQFVSAISGSTLIPGMKYRITDFVTTCNGVYDLTLIGQTGAYLPYATSAEHPFDLIVEAVSENEYNENVKATLHSGDTYFANNNLGAWELKWTHENDASKYSWADSTYGKGVIYYMRDEFNNIAYYDFKNIMNLQFALTRIDNTVDTNSAFDYSTNNGVRYGGLFDVFNVLQSQALKSNLKFMTQSLNGVDAINLLVFISDIRKSTLDSAMSWDYMLAGLSQTMGTTVTLAVLAQLLGTTEQVLSAMTERQVIEQFFNGKFYYTFDCEGQDLSNYIDDNDTIQTVGGGYCHDNNLGHCADGLTNFLSMQGESITVIPNGLNIMTFEASFDALNCFGNEFGANCFLNVFGNDCYSNKAKDYFYANIIANSCFSNLFRNGCRLNSFGNECHFNSFGNEFYSNSFGNGCVNNSFGDDCYNNTFGNGCYNNTFGNGCVNNSFGDDCYNNTFGNGCYYNSFGNSGFANSFGNSCNYNLLGNACFSNSFGNGCRANKLGDGSQVTFIFYNIFENGVSYVELTASGIGSDSNRLKNVTISQGVHGSSIDNRKVITATRNLDYQVIYKANNSTEVILDA